jgi:hypothetical protein
LHSTESDRRDQPSIIVVARVVVAATPLDARNWLANENAMGSAKIRLPNAQLELAEIHWYEAAGIGKREFKIKRFLQGVEAMADPANALAICVKNDGYGASLEFRKVYEFLPDAEASKHEQLRVVDESGEDYLYPKDYFVCIELPQAARHQVLGVPG